MSRLVSIAVTLIIVGALSWGPTQAADPSNKRITSTDITVHVTHDSASVVLGANDSSAVYIVEFFEEHHYWSSFFWGPFKTIEVGPGTSYQATTNGLEPDSVYVVRVGEKDQRVSSKATVSFRTEPAPTDWWETNVARDFRTAIYGDTILVGWDCISTVSREQFQVSVKEYGAPQSMSRSRVTPCTAGGMLFDQVLDGTTYVIELSLGHYTKTFVEYVPDTIGTRGSLDLDVPDWNVVVEYSTESKAWVFTVTVDAGDVSSLFEVEWIRDGHRLGRTGTGPTFVYHSDTPGPIPFRVRLTDGREAKSQWSSMRHAGLVPRPPAKREIRYQLRDATLHVVWCCGWPASAVDGYRVFLLGDGTPLQVADTGQRREASFQVDAAQSQYVLFVGSYSEDLGLGDLSRVEIDLEQPPELLLRVDKYQPRCSIDAGIPMRGFWSVDRGVPPYRVMVEGQAPVTSMLPYGTFESGCRVSDAQRTGDDELISQVRVEIEDSLGRRMSESLRFAIGAADNVIDGRVSADNEPGPVGLDVGPAMVGSTGLRVGMDMRTTESQYWLSRFIVRWRLAGEQRWNYELENVRVGLTWTAVIFWRDLEPDTSYEFQVGVAYPGISPEEMPEEVWSALQEITTHPPAIDAKVFRDGTTVTVRWSSQFNASTYSIVLRSENQSWWKSSFGQNPDGHEARFEGIPADVMVSVEVFTPRIGELRWNETPG